ncbi:Carbohydrate kinase, FGGY-like protein [Segniliparus rotundus DSM 44985]|uniref:Carbohydrate kinase, FGGY-like protein n=1 Tax=Segniliparus rotundus (strain ATCC BAA-972 / CDC 1076 / CIP 108378 / DSM 44985 / JCM 13578) TaxID=640132 RepID=D6ZCJ5_SEGRD|nr:FGGY-family carbohydrate kinase [Segniliparus rotundus]ADG97037.1 Carbohydrate kinase, FGGY-like protein [Segniliparus rotundus DSM 44985]
MDLVIGVDIGTGSSKGILAACDGKVLSTALSPHRMSLPRPGWAEMDAERDWWDGVCAITRELVEAAPPGSRIAGVCVSGIGPCLLLCDEQVRPLRPAILYGVDARATAEIQELAERFGPEAIAQKCGSALSSQAVGPKLAWARRHEPDVWARTRRWYSSNSYIVAKLTGEYIADHHTASQCDPLYLTREFAWNTEWADELLDHVPLPQLAWPSEVVGHVRQEASEATALPVGTPVLAGTVDAYAEAHSVGVRHPGDLMVMYGSTMFFVEVIDSFCHHPALWTTAGVQTGSLALAAGTSTAGSLISWLQSVTGGPDFDVLTREAESVPAGADGLLALPYLAGERTPIFDYDARGVFAGLTMNHTRGHLFRAAYEGIAFGVRDVLEAFGEAEAPVRRIVAIGGGVKSPVWTQAVSDITGQPQAITEQTAGASYGDALLAAVGVGLVTPETDWSHVVCKVIPREERRERYDRLHETWRELYRSSKSAVHQLAGEGNDHRRRSSDATV